MIRLSDKHFGIVDCGVRSLGRLTLGALVARHAGASVYASYVLLLTAEVICGTLANARFTQPLLTIAPGLQQEQRLALEAHVRRRIILTAAGLASLVLLLAPALNAVVAVSIPTLVLYGLATALTLVTDCGRAIRQGRFESARTVAADLLACGLPVVAMACTSPSHGDVLTRLYAFALLGQGLAWLLLRTPRSAPSIDRSTRSRLDDLALPFVAGSAITSATARSQPYLLAMMAGPSQLSGFASSASLAGPLRLVANALSAVLRPRLARAEGNGERAVAKRTLERALLYQTTLGCTLLLPSIALGPAVTGYVFGPEFAAFGHLLPIAVTFATLEGLGSLLTVAAQTRSPAGARHATSSRLRAGIASLALLGILGPLLGAVGAMSSMILGEVVFVSQMRRHRDLGEPGQLENRLRSIP